MAGVLGLGSGQAASLNQDLIDKLKEAERKARVAPIETNIENITANKDTFTEINQAVLSVLEAVRPLDLFVSDGVNAFEEKSASTSGDSVTFDATDITSLNNGFTSVNVTQIGQKDVYQSDLISTTDAENTFATGGIGNLTIQVGTGEVFEFQTGDTTDTQAVPPVYSTYQELTDAINAKTGVYATFDEVTSGQFRLVIKSEDVGAANNITIAGDASTKLGYNKDAYTSSTVADTASIVTTNSENLTINVDGTDYTIDIANKSYDDIVQAITDLGVDVNASIVEDSNNLGNYSIVVENANNSSISISGAASTTLGLTTLNRQSDSTNHTLTAQDMKMTVDGVDYEASSNKIVIDGLTITANRIGESTINIEDDTSYLESQIQNFVDTYNTLQKLVDDATAADSDMYNKSGLKAIVQQIKDKLFGSYGVNGDKSAFSYGLGLNNDLSGQINLDSTVFNKAVENDISGLRELFIGDAANKGLGTQLKELLDGMTFSDGAVSLFEDSLTKREKTLNTDKEKAEKALDAKYAQLSAQFAAYSTIITQFESSFGGLKMMIEQSVATN